MTDEAYSILDHQNLVTVLDRIRLFATLDQFRVRLEDAEDLLLVGHRFAEEHDLEVPTLLFSSFVNPKNPAPEPLGAFAFSVSWEDAAQAMRQALRAPSFPRPLEVMHIVADLPHGKYRNDRAKELLKWQPRDRLEAHWLRNLDDGAG